MEKYVGRDSDHGGGLPKIIYPSPHLPPPPLPDPCSSPSIYSPPLTPLLPPSNLSSIPDPPPSFFLTVMYAFFFLTPAFVL